MFSCVINLYGGPGSGKSTMAAGLFHHLKNAGISCELVIEFAKDVVWENTVAQLENQLWVFANQHHRIWKVYGKVHYVITDSPLLLNHVYCPEYFTNGPFLKLVDYEYNSLTNLDVFVERVKSFDPKGRLQNEDEAIELDERIKEVLDYLGITPYTYPGNEEGTLRLAKYLIRLANVGK